MNLKTSLLLGLFILGTCLSGISQVDSSSTTEARLVPFNFYFHEIGNLNPISEVEVTFWNDNGISKSIFSDKSGLALMFWGLNDLHPNISFRHPEYLDVQHLQYPLHNPVQSDALYSWLLIPLDSQLIPGPIVADNQGVMEDSLAFYLKLFKDNPNRHFMAYVYSVHDYSPNKIVDLWKDLPNVTHVNISGPIENSGGANCLINFKVIFYETNVGDRFVHRDILFPPSKITLMESSYSVLDSIANWLQENPNLIIEVGRHTDEVDPRASTAFTQRRAQVIVDYLISKGISPDRLSSKGYGDTQNLKENNNPDGTRNEENRAYNRRTEFKVVGIILRK